MRAVANPGFDNWEEKKVILAVPTVGSNKKKSSTVDIFKFEPEDIHVRQR